jgi:hypothetical protein
MSINIKVPLPLHKLYESSGLVIPERLCLLFGFPVGTKMKYLEITRQLFLYLETNKLTRETPDGRLIVPDNKLRHAFSIAEETITYQQMGIYLFNQFSR